MKFDVTKRLNRIEGQVRGIARMVEEDRACEDILVQIQAASASLGSVAKLILHHHIEHCVVDGIKSGSEDDTVQKLKKAVDQFSKMERSL